VQPVAVARDHRPIGEATEPFGEVVVVLVDCQQTRQLADGGRRGKQAEGGMHLVAGEVEGPPARLHARRAPGAGGQVGKAAGWRVSEIGARHEEGGEGAFVEAAERSEQ